MGNKEKGANTERELLHMLCEAGFACVRVAGSGLMSHSSQVTEDSCDLLAGKFKRKYAIEVKSCKAKKKYLLPQQIENFLIFSEIFQLKPVIAIKFNRQGWFFLEPKYIEKTKTGLAISLENAKKHGKRFEEFIS